MAQVKSKGCRAFVLFLLATMLLTGFGGINAAAASNAYDLPDSMVRSELTDIKSLLSSTSYAEYKQTWSEIKDATEDVVIYGDSAVGSINTEKTTAFNDIVKYHGVDNVLVAADDGDLAFDIEIKADAFYSIEIEYFTGEVYMAWCKCGEHKVVSETEIDLTATCPKCGKTLENSRSKDSAIERMVLIDGVVPFKEARSVELQRSWQDVYRVFAEDGKQTGTISSVDVDFFNKEYYKDIVNRPFVTDQNGNEKKPEKQIYAEWVKAYLYDSTGYASEPLKFYLSAGEHTITLDTVREPLVIKSVKLTTVEPLISYDEYIKMHDDAGAKDVAANIDVTIQGEISYKTSNKTIYQTSDRASAFTQPQDVSKTILNEIGGDKWQYVGQYIEWKFTVPETGYYKIVPRSIQDFYSGVYVSRKLYLDGVCPFEEAASLRFNYSDSWQTATLTDGSKDASGKNVEFKFFLTAGDHVMRMEVVLGNMAEVLSDVETSLNNINAYYRKILMITGPEPDEYRDYGFERTQPDVVRGFRREAENLERISAELEAIIGYKGDHSVTLNKVAYTVGQMGNFPNKIASLMDDLKTQSGSLGTWLTQTQNQPLNIDYIKFMSPSDKNPEAEAGFFTELWQEIKKFIMSFFTDYNSISSSSKTVAENIDSEHTIEVWTQTSRDQAAIIRGLLDDNFTAKYPGINVKVKLVALGTLLPSTLAGTGPDVSMGNAQTEAINYAIRSAVKALNYTEYNENGEPIGGYDFNDLKYYANLYKDDPTYSKLFEYDANGNPKLDENGNAISKIASFDEVKSRYAEQAMVPLSLYGKTYGIPENMSFYMLFYRKDILAELDLTVPVTWDDFYDMIYTLQSNKLEIGFPTGVTGSTIWMYQKGETMYDMGNYDAYMDKYGQQLIDEGNVYVDEEGNTRPMTDGMTINLDSDVALDCFKEVCTLYTHQDFPVSYDFSNRFRSGEMPMAIADYTAYNQLIVFAPEINGLWEFTPLPGTINPTDGTINNTTVGTVTTMMMMRSVDDRNNALAAYTFMQWWSSAEVQSGFGNEMEALLGPSAKQNTANIDALYSMPWSKSEFDNLSAQFKAVTCTPEFPGSYIIARYTNFAFLGVYNDGDEPVEKLLSYIPTINAELSRKREEFDLPTAERFPLDDGN